MVGSRTGIHYMAVIRRHVWLRVTCQPCRGGHAVQEIVIEMDTQRGVHYCCRNSREKLIFFFIVSHFPVLRVNTTSRHVDVEDAASQAAISKLFRVSISHLTLHLAYFFTKRNHLLVTRVIGGELTRFTRCFLRGSVILNVQSRLCNSNQQLIEHCVLTCSVNWR